MTALPPGGIGPDHQDYALIKKIEAALLRQAGGYQRFCSDVPHLFRKALDEVIDAPRTNRFTLDEIEKTEKTYIGTKIEVLFRNYLKLPKGNVLDLLVDGIEVDIKNTIGTAWAIPREALEHPCILMRCSERFARCWVGILVTRMEVLTTSKNQDGKRGISAEGLRNTYWLLKENPYPENFWETIDPQIRADINATRGGAERLAILFGRAPHKPISRTHVQAIAQQDDYMKRIRRNGGARDILAPKGIAILWGRKDRELIQMLGLPQCGPDEFVSIKAETSEQETLLRAAGHID